VYTGNSTARDNTSIVYDSTALLTREIANH
jgi:hypothetical protein